MLVGYMRVSTDSDRQSVDLQRDALLSAGVDERQLFEDKASGARDDRPGLKACFAYLKPGDTLCVWKLDRLGRSLSHLLSLVGELCERGVGFRSLAENLDTTSPTGELMFHIFGALAQYERALIRERVNAGLAAARKRGRKGGRPMTIDPEKLQQVLVALESGTSKAAVCRTFGIPRSTLADTLRRSGWTGSGLNPLGAH
jgi:DNA invertase Pin-like site-specific DNA recombinase